MTHPFGLVPSLEIVQLGEPVLRANAPAWDPNELTPELVALVDSMRDTMHRAPGVGLAAPQIGVSLRVAVLEDQWPVSSESAQAREREPLPYFVAIDPSYTELGSRKVTHYEGCLSMRGYTAAVERPSSVLASWLDLEGTRHEEELHGWQARIFQHETDHLNGILYIDKAITRSLSTDTNHALWWSQPTPDRAREGLGF